jgi:tellurite resistance protein TerC
MLGDYDLTVVALFLGATAFFFWLDLYAHRSDEPIGLGNALFWSVLWTIAAIAFAAYIYYVHGPNKASLFVTGYVLERSLSIDNLFVFLAIFASFSVPDRYQHRILYYGILGALILRLLFITAGLSALLLGDWVLTVFGILVLWSAWQMWRHSGKDAGDMEDYTQHWSTRLTSRLLPVHPYRVGHNFFTRIDGKLFVTPFFICLVVMQIADIIFAFDSVPAVIAVTRDPFLIYTSNIFALLGLRAMYFLLAAAKRYLVHLEKAVIAILVFIGLKMLADVAGVGHISPATNLWIVLGLLGAGVAASILFPARVAGQ